MAHTGNGLMTCPSPLAPGSASSQLRKIAENRWSHVGDHPSSPTPPRSPPPNGKTALPTRKRVGTPGGPLNGALYAVDGSEREGYKEG